MTWTTIHFVLARNPWIIAGAEAGVWHSPGKTLKDTGNHATGARKLWRPLSAKIYSCDDAQRPSPEMLFFLEKKPIMVELYSISAYYASIILYAFMLQILKTPPYYAKT